MHGEVFPKEMAEDLPPEGISLKGFSSGIKQAQIMIGGAILQLRVESLGGHEEDKIKMETIQYLKASLDESLQPEVTLEEQISLEDIKRKIQRNFNEDPLAWWEKNELKASLKVKTGKENEFVRYPYESRRS